MPLKLRPHDVFRETRADGTQILTARAPLGTVTRRTTDWLDFYADQTPTAVLLAERSGEGWRSVTYLQMQAAARRAAAGLLAMGLTPDTPILILTGNSVAHGTLALAAQYVGIPIVPLAEQYAMTPAAFGQIDHVVALTRPGAVFVEDIEDRADALALPCLAGCPVLSARGLGEIASQGQSDTNAIDWAHNGVGPDTLAKILMTSGSTSMPKGVRTTHRMMCTNQAQIAHALPFLAERPPVLVDWLPWNHVFGGSHNFNMALANGGALYIDGGKPVPHLMGKTIENNRLKQGTISFNVPLGFAAMRDAMKADPAFARAYFRDLDMLFYAGASLPQDVWADLSQMARDVRGDDMPLFTSSWGLTETAPAAVLQHQHTDRAGVIGVPLPGVDVKLRPLGEERFEVRVRGPSVFDSYHNDSVRTADAFDAEGYFRTGDAVRYVDPADVNQGLRFDGRLTEDFKLLSGTWVRASALRLEALAALDGLAQDVVVVGADRAHVGLLIVPTPGLRNAALSGRDGALTLGPEVADALAPLAEGGAASRITRALVMAEPPSMSEGEITAKGNLNFNRIQTRRADLVARLYGDDDPAVIRLEVPA